MAQIIQIKRGSQSQVDAASLEAAELAYATDTGGLYAGVNGGTTKSIIGGGVAMTGSDNRPAAAYRSKLFYATDVRTMYIDSGSAWLGFMPDLPWRALIKTTDYSDTPPTSSTITMNTNQTANIIAGQPVRFVVGGNTRYGRIKSLTSGLMTVQGAALTTGSGDLTELWTAPGSMVAKLTMFISGAYADSTGTNVYQARMKSQWRWELTKGHLVYVGMRHDTDAGTTNPYVNVLVNGNRTILDNSGNGVQVSTTFSSATDVGIDPSQYTINIGELVDAEVTVAGVGTSASDLTVEMVFVLEK